MCRCSCKSFLIKLQVPAGMKELRAPNSSSSFISTPSHSQLLTDMMQSHMAKDICLIGAKVANTPVHTESTHDTSELWSWLRKHFIFQGCGKSVIAKEFAEMLGYSIEPVMLYQVNNNNRNISEPLSMRAIHCSHMVSIWCIYFLFCSNLCELHSGGPRLQ